MSGIDKMQIKVNEIESQNKVLFNRLLESFAKLVVNGEDENGVYQINIENLTKNIETLVTYKATLDNFFSSLKDEYANEDLSILRKNIKRIKGDEVKFGGALKSSSARYIDKYNEKNRSYLNTCFYTISILSTSFFIYKQLNN